MTGWTSPTAGATGAPAARETPPVPCGNCGTPLAGDYCHRCGQRALGTPRLTVASLAREAAERFLQFESGFLRTLRDLTLRPGPAIRAYLDGARRRYVSPVGWLLLGAAVSLLFYRFVSSQGRFARSYLEGLFAHDPSLSDAQRRALVDIHLELIQHLELMTIAMVLPLALLVRLLFPRTVNLAEALVFSLFALGQTFWIDLPISLLADLFTDDFMALTLVTLLVYFGVVGWASHGSLGRGPWTIARASIAFALAYAVFSFAIQIGAELWVRSRLP